MHLVLILTLTLSVVHLEKTDSNNDLDEYENSLMEYISNEESEDIISNRNNVMDEAVMTSEERNQIFHAFTNKHSSKYSYVKMTESTKPLWGKCIDEDTFFTREECVQQCLNLTGSEFKSNNSSTLVTYKVLYLSGYQITLNDSMNIAFKPETFGLKDVSANDSIILCYPLSLTFDLCRKASLNLEEVGVIPPDRKLWSYKFNMLYETDEYYFDKAEEKVVVCSTRETLELRQLGFLRWMGLLISSVILFVALLESFSSASGLNNKPYILLRCYILVTFIGFTVFLLKHYLLQFTERLCTTLSMIQQHSFLSSFFWINAQAVELYIIKRDGYSNLNVKYPRRYFYYILYAVLVPAIVCTVTYAAEFLEVPGMNPKFGTNCWFITNSYEVLFFYYGWMGTILVINVVLLILTLKRFQPVVNIIDAATDANKFERLLKISIRLEVVLAVFWIIKFTTWLGGKRHSFLYHLDTVTYFQGLFVFLICCWKFNSSKPKTVNITKT